MSIQGSLETFSLPELLLIIESGRKSGKLKFKPSQRTINGEEAIEIFELWFDKGRFVAITNSSKYDFLVNQIIEHGWIESKCLVRAKYSCPKNIAFGDYLQEKNILSAWQLSLLFKTQINEFNKLFKVDSAWFNFKDIDSRTQVTSDGQTFPWQEMTGRQKKATKLSLTVMRDFSDWSRFAEEMPSDNCGLQKVVDDCNFQLTSLEEYLWNCSDGSISLKKIAGEVGVSIEEVQQTALIIIFAGLVEEVPITINNFQVKSTLESSKQPATREPSNVSVKTRNKSKVSSSLVHNLVSFLKNNF